MAVQQIGVVGLGIMGAGIVEVWARHGFTVTGLAESAEAVSHGKATFAASLQRSLDRGRLTAEQLESLNSLVTWTSKYENLHNCDLVIEAAPEFMNLKNSIFAQLDQHVKPEGILATNTSSLSVTEIAKATNRPHCVVGMHFFNPAPVQKFVEVISTAQSNASVVAEVVDLAKSLDKHVALVGDQPGFIVNRLLLAYINHAVSLLDEGIGSRDQIDNAMRTYAKYPMGPLELADLIGLDTCVEIVKTIGIVPAREMVALLEAGHKGRKSGQGFYDYSGERIAVPSESSQDLAVEKEIFQALEAAYLADARAMHVSGYASEADINNGMKFGCGLPEGPFEVMARNGTA